MDISIKEIESSIKKVFGNTKVYDTDSVYEAIDGTDNLKLVISLNKMFIEDISIIHNKLIFIVDPGKTKIIKDSFLYLYELNCQYSTVEFTDLQDFETKLKDKFKGKKFGNNLNNLSKFIKSPSVYINEWFEKNDVRELSIFEVAYEPKVSMIGCKFLTFDFDINVNNGTIIPLNILHENGVFTFNFKINEKNISVEKSNLSSIEEVIGSTLKNNL
jgi:hypothetical protein